MPSSTRQSVSARTGLPKKRERDTHLVIEVAYDSVIADGHLDGLVWFPDGKEEKRERATLQVDATTLLEGKKKREMKVSSSPRDDQKLSGRPMGGNQTVRREGVVRVYSRIVSPLLCACFLIRILSKSVT